MDPVIFFQSLLFTIYCLLILRKFSVHVQNSNGTPVHTCGADLKPPLHTRGYGKRLEKFIEPNLNWRTAENFKNFTSTSAENFKNFTSTCLVCTANITLTNF